jgi:hypothetical protein
MSASIRRFAQPQNPFAENYGSPAHNLHRGNVERPHQPEEARIAGNQADATGVETEPAFPAVYHLINTPTPSRIYFQNLADYF